MKIRDKDNKSPYNLGIKGKNRKVYFYNEFPYLKFHSYYHSMIENPPKEYEYIVTEGSVQPQDHFLYRLREPQSVHQV